MSCISRSDLSKKTGVLILNGSALSHSDLIERGRSTGTVAEDLRLIEQIPAQKAKDREVG